MYRGHYGNCSRGGHSGARGNSWSMAEAEMPAIGVAEAETPATPTILAETSKPLKGEWL